MQKRRLTLAKPATRSAPPAYIGTGTEVVDNLDATVSAGRLLAVATWHSERKGSRHATIARRLREAANENRAA